MTPALLPLLCALAVTAAATAQDPPPPARPAPEPAAQEVEKPKVYTVGTEVPEDLTLVDLDGKSLAMKEVRGKVVVLVWYAYQCPAIKQTEPLLKEMARKYAASEGEVVMYGIDSDRGELLDAEPQGVEEDGTPVKPYKALRTALAKRKVDFRIFVDRGNVVADLFQAKTTPHVFVLDQQGVVRYSGALDNDPAGRKQGEEKVNYVDDAVQALRAGKAVEVTETKPYG